MIVEPYTIVFQAINFLILVFLLRHFLYGPIIEAMDEREQIIVGREAEAAARTQEAEEEARSYQRRTDELSRQKDAILAEARASAEDAKHELLQEARLEVDATRHRWAQAFELEKETFVDELRRRIAQQSCFIARRCLADLADARLEELAWDVFVERMGALEEEERTKLAEALASEDPGITLRSSFDAPEEKVHAVKRTLQEILSDEDVRLNLSVVADPALVCGVELETGGYRVAWSVDNYLDGVEEQILKELESVTLSQRTGEVSDDDPARDEE